jgi:glycerol-3-phosphate dehydrogenase
LTAESDGRVFFVLPWLGLNLIGTTDIADAVTADAPDPSDAEIDNLLDEANRQFPQAKLHRDDIVSVFAGLRPLAPSNQAASRRSREHAILTPAPGLLALVGGKYTTYRAVSEELVDRIAAAAGIQQACRTASQPLPGGRLSWKPQDQWQRQGGYRNAVDALCQLGINANVATHWLDTYGAMTEHLVTLCRADARLLTPLCADLPHTEAEVVHAIRFEMARHLEDWYLRRSRIGLQPCHGFDSLTRVRET